MYYNEANYKQKFDFIKNYHDLFLGRKNLCRDVDENLHRKMLRIHSRRRSMGGMFAVPKELSFNPFIALGDSMRGETLSLMCHLYDAMYSLKTEEAVQEKIIREAVCPFLDEELSLLLRYCVNADNVELASKVAKAQLSL